MKEYLKKYWPLIISFIIPFIIMLIYFVYRNIQPFGNNSILTMDLGQQYVDFFSYIKRTLINHPGEFTYSFSNALGNNMIGDISYYLMSPLNLLIFLFPIKYMTAGLLFIILIKYGLSGLSMSYLLLNTKKTNYKLIPLWSIIYALNGWIIANQLNIMWLDGMILLPIIVLGVNRIINNYKSTTYIFGLSLILMINYYIGYMISIFIFLYIIYNLYIYSDTFKFLLKKILTFFKATLISGLLSSWILLPTLYSITQSKGQHTNQNIKWGIEYNPIQFIAKFFNGSLNFSQMFQGTPNIFVGSLTIICFLIFFFNHNITLKKKISTIILTLILLLSMFTNPLNTLWHAMQTPNGYPYRFSFIFCFWMIWIAVQGINYYPTTNKLRAFIPTIIFITIGIIYVVINYKNFEFIKISHVISGIILMFLTLIWILNIDKKIKGTILILTLIVISEMSLNAFNSLNNIVYINNSNYVNYTKMLKGTSSYVQNKDKSFYRIMKTFYRDENDPLGVGYNGGDSFSSNLGERTATFMGKIGQPGNDRFVEYGNGTILSDSLLSMKYIFNNQDSNNQNLNNMAQRPDVNKYNIIHNQNDISIYKNKWSLPLIFSGGNSALKYNNAINPMQYQNNIISYLTNDKYNNLFSVINFDKTIFNNVNNNNNITGSVFKRENIDEPANINFQLFPKTNDSYYLTLGNNINLNNSKIYINDKLVTQYPTYFNTIVLNVASNNKNKPIDIKVDLLKNNLWMQNFSLYHFDNSKFESGINELKSHSFNFNNKYISKNKFDGNITIDKNQSLITTIPYDEGWKLIVNGKKHPITQWSDTFIAAKLKPGKYHIDLSYYPPFLNIGILMTILTIIVLLIKKYFYNKR